MIVDAHLHIWKKVNGLIANTLPVTPLGGGLIRIGKQAMLGMPAAHLDCSARPEWVVAEFDAAGVDAGVVVQEFMDGAQNNYVAAAAKRFPGRLFAHALPQWFQPDRVAKGSLQLFERGFRGLKLAAGHFPGKLAIDDQRFWPIWARMEDAGLVLAVDLSEGQEQVGAMETTLARHPNLHVAIGHFGMVNRRGWPGQLRLCRHKNVFLESGGIIWLYRAEGYPFRGAIKAVKKAAGAVGMEKLMWGSDWPRTMVDFTYRQSIQFVRETNGLSESDKQLFLGENAARLYGLKSPRTQRQAAPLVTQG